METNNTEDDDIENRRNEEKQRQSSHFTVHEGDECGKGKRKKKQVQHFSFSQNYFKNLDEDERNNFLTCALNDYCISGKTTMLERHTTGFMLNQLSAKKGIEKYGRQAELKLIDEFKQLLEHQNFYGVNPNSLSKEEKKNPPT